jgi:hypothetical protein
MYATKRFDTRNLSFTFSTHQEATLHDINLFVAPGETVAIVGLNGSGKTTLLHVLARLIDFSSGTFYINDVPCQHFDASDLHQHTTAIFQSFCKFDRASVCENVGIGDVRILESDSTASRQDASGAAEDLIWDALAAAGAEKMVVRLDQGLETPLDSSTTAYGRYSTSIHLQHFDHPPPPYRSESPLSSVYSMHSGRGRYTPGKNGGARLSGGEVGAYFLDHWWMLCSRHKQIVAANCYCASLNAQADLRPNAYR